MRRLLAAAALTAGLAGCAGMLGGKDGAASPDFERAAGAEEASIKEQKARSDLGRLESAVGDYVKAEGRIPAKLDDLVPKYLAGMPSLDLPVCGGETEKVQGYPASVLRDGQVDGALIKGTGRWGYVHNERQVIVFVDCLKPSSKGVPWYRERGVY